MILHVYCIIRYRKYTCNTTEHAYYVEHDIHENTQIHENMPFYMNIHDIIPPFTPIVISYIIVNNVLYTVFYVFYTILQFMCI